MEVCEDLRVRGNEGNASGGSPSSGALEELILAQPLNERVELGWRVWEKPA